MKILRRDHAILLLTIALHGALFVSWTLQRRSSERPPVRRMDIVWLRAAAPPQREAAITPARPRAVTNNEGAQAQPVTRKAVSPLPITPPQEPAREAQQTPPPQRNDDPFALPAPTDADVVSQAKRDLAKIEQELRKGARPKELVLQADSTQAKLERGFNAAHDAVPPKWYQGATIKELNSTDPHKKIFRINTALGAYCILINEEGKRNYVNCPN